MFFHRIKSALLATAISFALVATALALVTDPNKIVPARTCSATQNLCYMRVTVNFNDPRIASGVWFGTIPKNSYVMDIDADVTTAFNAGTTNLLSIGATATGQDFLATSGVTLTATGVTHATTAAGLGVAATGNAALQTAINGDVPMYVRYQQTGTAATAGSVTFVVTFAQNNDQ